MINQVRTLHDTRHSRSQAERSSENGSYNGPLHTYIALGSNVGDRVANIEKACHEMRADGLQISRTSSLYESPPMYVVDQDPFVNAVVEVRLSLQARCCTDSMYQVRPRESHSPLELLAKVKDIERKLGRQKTIDKGPRNIDLDIVLHGDQTWESPDLSVPHKAMLEREFVLRPLCE